MDILSFYFPSVDDFDAYIIVSFVNATLVLSIGETVEEVTDSGFLGTTPTISSSQLGDDALVQVWPFPLPIIDVEHILNLYILSTIWMFQMTFTEDFNLRNFYFNLCVWEEKCLLMWNNCFLEIYIWMVLWVNVVLLDIIATYHVDINISFQSIFKNQDKIHRIVYYYQYSHFAIFFW